MFDFLANVMRHMRLAFSTPRHSCVQKKHWPSSPAFLQHKDHMARCPDCARHYLCREIVCRLVCATCELKYKAAEVCPPSRIIEE